jgi:hypothetical protein
MAMIDWDAEQGVFPILLFLNDIISNVEVTTN